MSTRHSTQIASWVLIAMTVFAFSCTQQGNEGTTSSTTSDGFDRTTLPIKEPARQIYKELDARNAKAPARWEVKAPQGAPNVVVVLIDDMGTLEARKNRFIIITDLQYSNLGTDHPTPGPLFTSATADFKTFILDPEVGYRIAENTDKGTSVDVVGGFRYWHLKSDLTFTAGLLPAVTASRSRGWVDAVGGIRGRARLSKRLFVIGKADLGGGGSKFTYQLFGGMGLLMGKRFALIGGYRDLSVNYNKDNFLFDVALHGPIIGLSIRF